MIEQIRAFATSWVAKILLALLVASFAVWGVQLTAFGGHAVAEIGDEEISIPEFRRSFAEQLQIVNQFSNRPYTEQEAMADQLHLYVVRVLQREHALAQESAKLGVDAPDEAVRRRIEADPNFGGGGGFDPQAYERALAFMGFRKTEYEERERRRLAIGLVESAVGYGAAAPRRIAETLWRRENETRDLGVLTLTAAEIAQPEDPGDATLKAHHEANPDRFTAPERRVVELLWLRPSLLADVDAVEESRLREMYDAAGERFNTPERRNLERLDLDSEEAASDAAAKARAGAPLQTVAGGEAAGAFAALGYVTRAEIAGFDAALANAAFAADADAVLEPIETAAGWTVIRVAGVLPGRSTPFSEVRDALAQQIATDAARRETPGIANAIEDSRAAGASFEEIAEQKGVSFQELDLDLAGRDPDGRRVADLPQDPEFLRRIFDQARGEERDLIQTPAQGYWTALVKEVRPAAVRPLAEARDDVLADWRAAQIAEALDARAAEAERRIEAGETVQAVATSLGVAAETIEAVARTGSGALPTRAVEAAFAHPPETAVGSADVVAEGDRRLVVATLAVETPDPAEAAEAIEALRDQASAEIVQEIRILYGVAVENGYESQIYVNAVEQALTQPLR